MRWVVAWGGTGRAVAAMLAESAFDVVGDWFGVSAGVVIAVCIGLWLLGTFGDDAKKRVVQHRDEVARTSQTRHAVATGAGVLASRRAQTTGGLVEVRCREARHDLCRSSVCACTCHAVAVSSFCGDLGRHDLCPGAVVVNNVGAAPCGCTCHDRSGVAAVSGGRPEQAAAGPVIEARAVSSASSAPPAAGLRTKSCREGDHLRCTGRGTKPGHQGFIDCGCTCHAKGASRAGRETSTGALPAERASVRADALRVGSRVLLASGVHRVEAIRDVPGDPASVALDLDDGSTLAVARDGLVVRVANAAR